MQTSSLLIWTEERPAAPATKAWILDAAYAGKTPSEKLADSP